MGPWEDGSSDKNSWWQTTVDALSTGWADWNKNKTSQNNANQTASVVSGVVTIASFVAAALFVLSLLKSKKIF